MSKFLRTSQRSVRYLVLGGLGLFLASSSASAQTIFGGSQYGSGGGSSSSSTATGMVGSQQGGLFGGLGGTVNGPTTANILRPYYANPYSIGMPTQLNQTGGGSNSSGLSLNTGSLNQKPTFGVPVFSGTTTGSTGITTGTPGTTGISGGLGTSGSLGMTGGTKTSTTGLGSTGLGSTGLGSTGLGSTSLGSTTGYGSTGLGSTGLGSATKGLGTTGTSYGSTTGLGTTKPGGSTGLGTPGLGAPGGTINSMGGFNAIGAQHNAPYVTVAGATLIPPTPVQAPVAVPAPTSAFAAPVPGTAHFNAAQSLQFSSQLPSRDNIQVGLHGQTYFLKGAVASEQERQLAEALLRLTPGVHSVQNNLVVGGQ
jgi:hypothetical protein